MSHCQRREEPLPFSLKRTKEGNRKVLNMAQIHCTKDLYENEDLSLLFADLSHSFIAVFQNTQSPIADRSAYPGLPLSLLLLPDILLCL